MTRVLPDPWQAVVLILAAYRWTRLGGWDDWPPIYRVRAWIIGERWIVAADVYRATDGGRFVVAKGFLAEAPGGFEKLDEPAELELPGKQPTSEAEGLRPAYSRPTLAHLVHCPFCLGWWVSLIAYVLWVFLPDAWMMALSVPFAISGAVGLIAKNLDA